MYKIQTLNNISEKGLMLFPKEGFHIGEKVTDPDGIIVRSFKMNDMELPVTLKGIARAGAGVNNIPVSRCTEKGIVVFNTPGANANSVKELVLSALFLSTRHLYDAIDWVKGIAGKGDEVPKMVEKGKSQFTGPEIKGKKLGVIGLGAIGSMVANDAVALGMEVSGFDPYISVEAAWGLSSSVKRAKSVDALLADSDFITLHIPLVDGTKGFLNKERFSQMKKGAVVLNFARGELVDTAALKAAIGSETVAAYVTDFPNDDLLGQDKVIPIPHLGASTPEAEENCAVMAVKQLKDFLEKGNIVNSVNFPNCEMEMTGATRLVIANKNVPKMINQITTALAEQKINIAEMLNRHKDDVAYNIIDVEGVVKPEVIDKITKIEGVLMARLIGA
ncbi:MAG TPA: 3-phosphoglycerate dehydrogenase [Spirochaetia bacterium]|nr:3-phosphoglycerate dehydrogenase [Spirochaetia bacterium]